MGTDALGAQCDNGYDKLGQLPAALAPDQDYDRNGCFSGSAIEADNKHVLVYTGVTKITLPDGREEERQNHASHSGMAGIM